MALRATQGDEISVVSEIVGAARERRGREDAGSVEAVRASAPRRRSEPIQAHRAWARTLRLRHVIIGRTRQSQQLALLRDRQAVFRINPLTALVNRGVSLFLEKVQLPFELTDLLVQLPLFCVGLLLQLFAPVTEHVGQSRQGLLLPKPDRRWMYPMRLCNLRSGFVPLDGFDRHFRLQAG